MKNVVVLITLLFLGTMVFLVMPSDISYQDVIIGYGKLPYKNEFKEFDKDTFSKDVKDNSMLVANAFLFPMKANVAVRDSVNITYSANAGHYNGGSAHYGADLLYNPGKTTGSGETKSGKGVTVVSSAKGVVTMSQRVPKSAYGGQGTGETVKILGDDGFEYLYYHMAVGSRKVNVNDRVDVGSELGIVGNTGNSSGEHLHYEVRQGNTKMNPWTLEPLSTTAGRVSPATGGSDVRYYFDNTIKCYTVMADNRSGNQCLNKYQVIPNGNGYTPEVK